MKTRKSIRINVNNLIKFTNYDETGKELTIGEGTAKNISINGVYFLTKNELEINSFINIILDINDLSLKLKGKVVRVNKENNIYGTGIQFLIEDEETERMLQNLSVL